jgi:hypothetical protein
MAGVEPIYIDTAIEAIQEQYKSLEDYLAHAGIKMKQIEIFRAQMLE